MISDFELAARLRDAHAPEAPAWWPPAPGWWLLLLAALILAALVLRAMRPRLHRWRLRRRLLAALEGIARGHRAGATKSETAAAVSQLLRLAALQRFPDRGVAGLHGGDWVAFLESCDRAPGRFAALREALTAGPYSAPAADSQGPGMDIDPLLGAARGWLRAVV
jgi:Domain of unknown function (DUF4381)